MSTNDQPVKFSYTRRLRFATSRLLLAAVLLAGFVGCDTVEGMNAEADVLTESVETAGKGVAHLLRFGDGDDKSRMAGFEAAVPPDSSVTQNATDCYELQYHNGEWIWVRVECPL